MTKYRCWFSDQYYTATPGCNRQTFSTVCKSDPHSYQVCGQHTCDDIKHSDQHYCGSYVCDDFSMYCYTCSYEYYFDLLLTCNNISQCSNGADEQYCDWNDKVLCKGNDYSTAYIKTDQVCDGIRDCWYGHDEAGCNHTAGIDCIELGVIRWVHPYYICNDLTSCDSGKDEENCTEYSNSSTCNWCNSYDPFNKRQEGPRCLHANQMCSHPSQSMCTDHKDQLNCTDSVYTCPIHSYPTTIRAANLCDGYDACDDGFDENCELSGLSCQVHKNRLCDDVEDCENGGDEKKYICKQVVNRTCLRHLNRGSELPIPLEWLCDNVEDCINGIDEDKTQWKVCGAGDRQRCIEPGKECNEMLKCPGSTTEPMYVKNEELCDNFETCPGENALCQVSHSTEIISNSVIEVNKVKHLSFCLPGFDPKGLHNCKVGEFNNFELVRVVDPIKLYYPAAKQSCLHVYGEQYVYNSCKNICKEPNIPCPLRPIKYDSCPYSMRKKLYIPSDSQYLTLVEKNRGSFSNAIFPCNNGNCVSYKEVCDLTDDCGDASDELECKNHFRCNTTGKFIHIGGLCNNIIECFDRSDECECGKTKRIVNNAALKILSWIAGGLATSINSFLLVKNGIFLYKTESRPPFTNSFLVMLISIGDLLVGLYLLAVAAADYVYSEDYCIDEHKWLGSTQCSLMGVFSTIGSQISLFSMTALSLYRAHSLSRISAPGDVSPKYKAKMVFTAVVITLMSVAIAVIPQIPSFEDYFINGLYYPSNPMFVGAPNKAQHITTIQEYHGEVASKDIPWATLRILVLDMFTQDNGTVIGDNQGFYSNDGSCLFKYFVNDDDPQKVYSLAVLMVNSVCFLIITTCYITVNIITMASSRASSSSNDSSRRLQQKIAIIVLTDFACWIPFILTCLLHFAGVFDATEYYGFFSIIVLPLNSVINPIIYDGAIVNMISTAWVFIKRKANVFRQSINATNATTVTCNPVAIEMLDIPRSQTLVENRKEDSTIYTHITFNRVQGAKEVNS